MTAPRPSIPSDPTAPSAPAPASPAPSNPAASTSASSTPALSTPVPSTPAPSAPPAPAATALEALAASEERYRLALEANDEGAWDWDLAAGAVLVNDRAYTLLGYAPGEVQATYDLWRRCLHPEDAPRVERALSAYLAGESPDYRSEHRVVIKSGEIRWHRVTGKAVYRAVDGTPTRLIGVMQDITDQKEREMRLQETLDLLRLALEAADIGLWRWDLESDKLEWDERLCHWYGVPEETRATGLYYDFWQNRLHPADRERAEGCLLEALRNRRPYEDEFRIRLPDGQIRFIQTRAAYHRDSQTLHTRVVGINRDITVKRQREAELRQAKETAEAANAAKSRFLTAVTHELRTPLHAILGFSEVLLGILDQARTADRPQPLAPISTAAATSASNPAPAPAPAPVLKAAETPAASSTPPPAPISVPLSEVAGVAAADPSLLRHQRLRGAATTIQRNAKQLLTLVNDILDWTRSERGQLELQPRPINPRTVPRECLTDLAPLATAKGLTLQLTIAPGVPTRVLLDPLRLQQILNNLLINSVKFTRRGEIHLEVGVQPAAPGRIGLWFRVMDTGPGITPADQERLFEPFFQSLTGEDVPASFRGHGVGLPLSRELARAMAGELRVESRPEGGSRFTLILPSVPLAEEGDSASAPVDTVRTRPAEGQPEPEPERRPEHRPEHQSGRHPLSPVELSPDAPPQPQPPCQAELQPARQQWTPATAKPPEDLVAPPAEALTELRELAIRGLNQRIRAWCRHGAVPERQPVFAARVMDLATQFDHASILTLVNAALDAAPKGFARSAEQEESRP